MIVKTGRNLIASKNLTSSEELSKFKFFIEPTSNNLTDIEYMTNPEYTVRELSSNIFETSEAVTSQPEEDLSNISETTLYAEWLEDSLELKFTAVIVGTSENEGIYAAAGLIYDDSTLFSRVTFKETTLEKDSKYKMEYIIYF